MSWAVAITGDDEQLVGELHFLLSSLLEDTKHGFKVNVGDTTFPTILVTFKNGSNLGHIHRALRDYAGLQRRTLAKAKAGPDTFHLIKVSL